MGEGFGLSPYFHTQGERMQKMKREDGTYHGLVMTLPNNVQHDTRKLTDAKRKDIDAQRKADAEPVKVTYYNLRVGENGRWEGAYFEIPGNPIQKWCLINGETYEIPRGLVRKINDMGTPKRSGVLGSNGQPTEKDGPIEQTHRLVPAGSF